MPHGLLASAPTSLSLGLIGLTGCAIGYGIAWFLHAQKASPPAPAREQLPRKLVHSIKNALFPIRLYPDLVKRNLQRPAKAAEILDKMIAASTKAFGRFEDFNLIFGGTECEETTTPTPAAHIQRLLDTEGLQQEVPEVKLSFQNQGDTAIAVPPRSFERLALNLIQNACIAVQDQPQPAVTLITRKLPDGRFELAVTDTGKGPDDNVLAYLNHSTRSPSILSPDVGMGLTLVAAITKASAGTLSPEVASDSFTIRVQFPPLGTAS